nr:MAG TPA: hypothetical protein [Caudoviricetes sp.]
MKRNFNGSGNYQPSSNAVRVYATSYFMKL